MQARRQRITIWLALVALVFQFVVACVHHHHEHGQPASIAAIAGVPVNSDGTPDSDDEPSGCNICWALGLVAAVALPVLIGLLLADRSRPTFQRPTGQLVSGSCLALAFDARGPPSGCFAT